MCILISHASVRRLAPFCAAVSLLASGCGTMTVELRSDPKAPPKLADIKRIAIGGVKSRSRLVDEQYFSNMLASKIAETQFYTVVERGKAQKLLEEQGFQMSAVVDERTATKAGQMLGVDAMVFGEVSAAKVSTHQGTKAFDVMQPDGTTRRQIKRTAYKKGVVSVNLALVKVSTGERILSFAKTQEVQEPPFREAIGDAQIAQLGTDDSIVRELVEELCLQFVDGIRPLVAVGERTVHKGAGAEMERGYALAEKNLWDMAAEQWQKAIQTDSNNAAAYNNLGVAAERNGDRAKAEEYYKKAVSLAPTEADFLANLSGLRNPKIKQLKHKKKKSGRASLQFWSGLISSLTEREAGVVPNQNVPQSRPVAPRARTQQNAYYRCPSCGKTLRGPSANVKLICPYCRKPMRTYACPCGNRFATPIFMTTARCGRCGRTLYNTAR